MNARRFAWMLGMTAVTTAALAASIGATAVSQAPQASADPLAALLSEVHALRVAMEQSASLGPRVQVTLARLNIEEQRTAQLGAQLDQVRRELTDTEAESEKTIQAVADIERMLQNAADEKLRFQAEVEQRDLKRRQQTLAGRLQQLHVRENDAAQTLATEQARWSDLNARLDELERLLGSVRP